MHTHRQACLGVKDKQVELVEFYDLDEQSLIRADCIKLAQRLTSSDGGCAGADQDNCSGSILTEPTTKHDAEQLAVSSELESIITTFAKTEKLIYTTDNGYVHIGGTVAAA